MLEALPDLVFRLSNDGEHLDFYAASEDQLYLAPEISSESVLINRSPKRLVRSTSIISGKRSKLVRYRVSNINLIFRKDQDFQKVK